MPIMVSAEGGDLEESRSIRTETVVRPNGELVIGTANRRAKCGGTSSVRISGLCRGSFGSKKSLRRNRVPGRLKVVLQEVISFAYDRS